ncbi:histidine phosphatase family protein [Azospirillum sp.]|uniref:histidine phosphatase family protein n=1 Tax=Azospirillum sp. TaxID=34012 RepID=UPI003D75B175
MNLIFARHGNTFGPGDKVVWVGRETDLPLVERGEEQAREAAEALRAAGLVPASVTSGTLKRTRGFAGIVRDALCPQVTAVQDPRLDEIDYGAWAGLSSEEIAARPGGTAMAEAWQKEDVWPDGAGWRSTQAEILDALRSFLDELLATAKDGKTRLVVSSNGTLRFVPRLLGIAEPGVSYQMKTGHLGLVRRNADGALKLMCWNAKPAEFAAQQV